MLFRATRVNLRKKCCEATLGPRFRPYPTRAECLDFFRCKTTEQVLLIAAAVSEPEASERGSSLIGKKLHYRGIQSLFLTKRKELWLCATQRFRMRNGLARNCG